MLSGILVAAVLGVVSFLAWEFLGTAEERPRPRIVYGPSGTASASSQRPMSKKDVADPSMAEPLGKNKWLKGYQNAVDKPEPEKQSASNQPRETSVPKRIAESTQKGRWIFIDKANFRLYLADGNTVVDSWRIAVGKVTGNKRKGGDNRTPEGADFSVQQIQDAHTWTRDFHDGKGAIKGAYGPWFIRLKTGWQGIGICGTHDPDSIGTLASVGSVLLKNEDLVSLHQYVTVGMKVVIGPNADGSTKEELSSAPEKTDVSTTKDSVKKVTKKRTSGRRSTAKRSRRRK